MKVTALFLIISMVFASVFTAKANGMRMAESCCHKMAKTKPCSHQQKSDCGQGMCSNMLSCNTCGFLKTEPLNVGAIVPILKEPSVTPYYLGGLAAYSPPSWRPPKV